MHFLKIPVSGAVVCESELCRRGAMEDAHSISHGRANADALALMHHAQVEIGDKGCWMCGVRNLAAYRKMHV